MTIVRCAAALLIAALAAASSFGQSQPTPSRFVATYFAADGRVVIDKGYEHSQTLAGLSVLGPGVPFDSDLVSSAIPTFPDLNTPGPWFVDISILNEVSWFLGAGTRSVELAGVMPPRLSSETLENNYVTKYLLGGSGLHTPQAMDWRYVPVPEASTGALAGLGSIALLLRRWLRRCNCPS